MIDAVVHILSDVGVTVIEQRPLTERSDDDIEVTLGAGDRGHATYLAVVRHGRLDRRLATAMPLPGRRPLLLVSDHVPDDAADVLRTRGIDHVDAAGNMHLAWDGLLVDVRGRRPHAPTQRAPRDRAAARAFTRSGAMVTFALLSWPDLASRPIRQIAEASGVATGTVHIVMRELTAAGYLRDGVHGRALNRAGELLDRWAEAYTVRLSRSLALSSYTPLDVDGLSQLERDLLADGAQLGGELAASRIDTHLQPATATFYASEVPASVIAKYRLRRDESGPVQFRRRFWHRPDGPGTVVPSPLVYADLVSSGDPRQREHAERIRGVDDRLVDLDRT